MGEVLGPGVGEQCGCLWADGGLPLPLFFPRFPWAASAPAAFIGASSGGDAKCRSGSRPHRSPPPLALCPRILLLFSVLTLLFLFVAVADAKGGRRGGKVKGKTNLPFANVAGQ